MALQTPTMTELLEAGVHFGHKVSRGHPRMKPYIFGARDGVHILDLAQSETKLKEAIEYVYELGKSGGVLLVVGTKKQAQEIVEELSLAAGAPYVNAHWVGGMLTNFDEVKKNINRLNSLQKERETGELSRYTKKEQLLISRKIAKFQDNLGGVSQLSKIPDAMFIVDSVNEDTAVKEALRMGIKLVGFADTNSNPAVFDYPIPANDDGIKAIKIVCEAVVKAYGEGKKAAGEIAAKKAVDDAKEAARVAEAAKLDTVVAEQAEVIEEEIEKKIVQDSERKE